jgi:hypothetical protein
LFDLRGKLRLKAGWPKGRHFIFGASTAPQFHPGSMNREGEISEAPFV